MLNIEGTDEQRMLRKPSSNDQVVHVFPSGTLDDKPDGDVFVGNRCTTNGAKYVGMTLKIT